MNNCPHYRKVEVTEKTEVSETIEEVEAAAELEEVQVKHIHTQEVVGKVMKTTVKARRTAARKVEDFNFLQFDKYCVSF